MTPYDCWVTDVERGETDYLAAASSDGSGAGPFMTGFATPTAGAFEGVVCVLVAPTLIDDDFVASGYPS